MAVSKYRTSDFEVVGGAAMSLSRGTVPKPSTPGLIGQLTEGSQKSTLRNGLKRRTLRPSTIHGSRNSATGLPLAQWIQDPDRVPIDVFAKMKISLFRPRGMTRAKKSRGKRICKFPSPQKRRHSTSNSIHLQQRDSCMVADHAQPQHPTSELS
jgi:hypothetical protein